MSPRITRYDLGLRRERDVGRQQWRRRPSRPTSLAAHCHLRSTCYHSRHALGVQLLDCPHGR